jgi:hypothetical protein
MCVDGDCIARALHLSATVDSLRENATRCSHQPPLSADVTAIKRERTNLPDGSTEPR